MMKDLTIEVSNSCSLGCVHCSTKSSRKGNILIPSQKISRILNQFPDFQNVRFSGGEPLEHPEILRIVSDAKRKEKTVQILSSGVAYLGAVPFCLLRDLSYFVENIVFSIYGGKEVHNDVCGTDCYDYLVETIRRTKQARTGFSFQTVAMQKNQEALEEIAEYISETKKGIDYCVPKLHVLRFIKQGRGEKNPTQAIGEEDIQRLTEATKDISKKYDIDITLGCSLKQEGCKQGNGKAVVTAYGEGVTCSALKYGSRQEKFACKDRW